MRKYGMWIAGGFLIVVHVIVLAAGFIAPYDPVDQDRMHAWAPPTPLHFRDQSGFHLRPFVRDRQMVDFGEYAEDQARTFPVRFFCKGAQYSFLRFSHSQRHLFCTDSSVRVALLGTDGFGRDVFSRLLYGAQISLGAGLLATVVCLAVGLLIGTIAGYRAGWTDEVLMGSSELLLTLPWLYLLLALRAALPLHIGAAESFLLVVCVVSLLGWARPARLIRGVVLSAKTRNYVAAARGFGATDIYVVRRHILPAVFAILLTQAAMLVPQFVAAEVSLSFFGLGVGEPTPSWGNMLGTLQQYRVLTSYWWMLAPAVALIAISISYCFLADTIQTRLQSRST